MAVGAAAYRHPKDESSRRHFFLLAALRFIDQDDIDEDRLA
jgi:hypothetical protein